MYAYLSESQKRAVDLIRSGYNTFITGPAGTGKSYLLQFLKRDLQNKNLQITATTGIAAVNINGVTLHHWAALGIESVPLEQIINKAFSSRGTNIRRKLQSTDILAIDEISMLSKETFELLDQLLRKVRDSDIAFGGIQLVLFGDFLQLPPVKSKSFCFESESWIEANIYVIELQEIFRQKNPRFLKLLNNIRYGIKDIDDIKLLKTRFCAVENHHINIAPTILSTHNNIVEHINLTKLQELPSLEHVFEAQYDGNLNKIEFLKSNCIAQDKLYLKLGAQVIMLKNTYQKQGIINGSNGIVVGFSLKKHYPIVEFENGEVITVTPEAWEIHNFNHLTNELIVEASMIQIPLKLAWAITVHKSQGMTFDKIQCDLQHTFIEGQTYTALSRVRDISGLFISAFNVNNIRANLKVLEFYASLK